VEVIMEEVEVIMGEVIMVEVIMGEVIMGEVTMVIIITTEVMDWH